MAQKTKVCSQCHVEKPIEQFSRNKGTKDGMCYTCKQCSSERLRIWYKKNRDRIRETQQEYAAAHKAESTERNRRWRENNPIRANEKVYEWNRNNYERYIARRRKWADENREKLREQDRELRLKHLEQRRQASKIAARNWRRKYPDRQKQSDSNKRAKRIAAEGSFTNAEFKELCIKYHNRCLRCRADDVKLTVDHVIPLSRGGTNYISNIQPLCLRCNVSKNSKTIDYRTDYELA